MIVGIWRAERCGHASLMEHLVNANPTVDFTFHVCTDPYKRCTEKHLFGCGQSVRTYSLMDVADSVRMLYKDASTTFIRSEDFDKDIDDANPRLNSSFALREGDHGIDKLMNPKHYRRARHCFESALRLYQGTLKFDAALVLRPDVMFSRPLKLNLKRKAVTIIMGHYVRPCVFAERDFDFGYMGVPPAALITWFLPTVSAIRDPQAPLPAGFNGTWQEPAASSNTCSDSNDFCPVCGKDATVTRSLTAPMENKLRDLDAAGTPLTAMHVASGQAIFLSIITPKDCELAYINAQTEGGQESTQVFSRVDTANLTQLAARWGNRIDSRGKKDMPACLLKRLVFNRSESMPRWGLSAFRACCTPERECHKGPRDVYTESMR